MRNGGHVGRRCWRSSRAIINTSGLVKAANNYNLSECCEVKTHLHEHAQLEWLLLWRLASICHIQLWEKYKRPLQKYRFLWFFYTLIGMCLSKMNIFVSSQKRQTTFLPISKWKYCHFEHLLAENGKWSKERKRMQCFWTSNNVMKTWWIHFKTTQY